MSSGSNSILIRWLWRTLFRSWLLFRRLFQEKRPSMATVVYTNHTRWVATLIWQNLRTSKKHSKSKTAILHVQDFCVCIFGHVCVGKPFHLMEKCSTIQAVTSLTRGCISPARKPQIHFWIVFPLAVSNTTLRFMEESSDVLGGKPASLHRSTSDVLQLMQVKDKSSLLWAMKITDSTARKKSCCLLTLRDCIFAGCCWQRCKVRKPKSKNPDPKWDSKSVHSLWCSISVTASWHTSSLSPVQASLHRRLTGGGLIFLWNGFCDMCSSGD